MAQFHPDSKLDSCSRFHMVPPTTELGANELPSSLSRAQPRSYNTTVFPYIYTI